jgi:hypothetical protein
LNGRDALADANRWIIQRKPPFFHLSAVSARSNDRNAVHAG